jgi:hypothetical protein
VGAAATGCAASGAFAKGASLESARAEVDRLAENLEAAYPDTNTGKRFHLRTLQDRSWRGPAGLDAAPGAVRVLVLIACANVSSLLLVRASANGRARDSNCD